MKNTIIILTVILSTFHIAFGQKNRKNAERFKADTIDGVYIPKNLEDCFREINRMLDDSIKTEIKDLSEDFFTANSHFGLGIWMRNNWYLWGGSRLSIYFIEKEIYHPDAMSGIILTSYYRSLTGTDVDLEGQINYYQTYWKVGALPRKSTYPKGARKAVFNTKRYYTLKDSNLPACIHIQTNSKTNMVWAYDLHLGWQQLTDEDLKTLEATNDENRETTIRSLFSRE